MTLLEVMYDRNSFLDKQFARSHLMLKRREVGMAENLWHLMISEAYHLEASKFSLYVGNNAGVFQMTNEKRGSVFAQIWKQRIEGKLALNNGGLLE